MDYFKRVLLVAFGALILVGITAGIYGTMAFRENLSDAKQNKKQKELAFSAYDPIIIIPDQKCNLVATKRKAYYTVVRTSNIAEIKQLLLDSVEKFDGSVFSSYEGMGFDNLAQMNTETLNLMVSFKIDQGDEYLKYIKKTITAPNYFENESLSDILANKDCEHYLEQLKMSSAQEKMLLNKIKLLETGNASNNESWSSMLAELNQIRQTALDQIRQIDFLLEKSNTFEASFNVMSFPG